MFLNILYSENNVLFPTLEGIVGSFPSLATAAPHHQTPTADTGDRETSESHITMDKDNLPSVKGIDLIDYVDESQLNDVMRLVGQDLSEPYSSKFFC